MLKYLRIAVTALSLTTCVLLVAPWVRSYWWADILEGFNTNSFEFVIGSQRGIVACGWRTNPLDVLRVEQWHLDGYYPDTSYPFPGLPENYFGRSDDGSLQRIDMPTWFLVLLPASIAAFPWLPRWSTRFSLRTLLIATTLVAVGLGGIMLSR